MWPHKVRNSAKRVGTGLLSKVEHQGSGGKIPTKLNGMDSEGGPTMVFRNSAAGHLRRENLIDQEASNKLRSFGRRQEVTNPAADFRGEG